MGHSSTRRRTKDTPNINERFPVVQKHQRQKARFLAAVRARGLAARLPSQLTNLRGKHNGCAVRFYPDRLWVQIPPPAFQPKCVGAARQFQPPHSHRRCRMLWTIQLPKDIGEQAAKLMHQPGFEGIGLQNPAEAIFTRVEMSAGSIERLGRIKLVLRNGFVRQHLGSEMTLEGVRMTYYVIRPDCSFDNRLGFVRFDERGEDDNVLNIVSVDALPAWVRKGLRELQPIRRRVG